jgi:hypothetical protein
MSERLQKAYELQRKAYAVIERLGLNTIWAEVGNPVLVGSVRFGLISKPNIDYEIYTPVPKIADGFSVIRRIAETPGVTHIDYANFLQSPDPGLYWRIDYVDDAGLTWDIDNWLVPDDHPHAGVADNLADAMARVLTDETREKILKIKEAIYGTLTTRGIEIYKAVLRDRIDSPDAFREWHTRNATGRDIDRWHP